MLAGAGGRPEPGQTEQTANSGRGWVGRGTRRSKCLRSRDSLQLAEAARGCWTEQHLPRPLSHRLRAMAQNISLIINKKFWNLIFCAGYKIICILFYSHNSAACAGPVSVSGVQARRGLYLFMLIYSVAS